MIQVVGWVALGAVAVTILQILRRYALMDRRISVSHFLVGTFCAATLGFGVLYVSMWGWTMPPHLSAGFYTVVVVGALVNVAIQGFNAKAGTYTLGDVSYTAPLQAMTPLLLTLSAFVAGEFPGIYGWTGVMIMMAGSYLLMFKEPPEKWWGYLSPFLVAAKSFRDSKDPAKRQQAIVTMLALGSAAFGTIGLLCDGLMVRRAGGMQGIIFGSLLIVSILAVSYGLMAIPTFFVKRERTTDSTMFATVMFAAFAGVWVMHVLLIQPQFAHALIAYVGTLKRFSVLFSVVAGALVFGERDFKKRLFAAVLIVVGAILIALDPAPANLAGRLTELGF